MQKINESYEELKKSKFYGYLYSVNDVSEVDLIIEEVWKNNKKARHVVYAYKIGNKEKCYADKEPMGTTRGLLDVINKNNLDNTLIVVVRYFGGVLLGSGPLTRIYTRVSASLVKK